ncbi:MAG: lipopolysaccharide biosynthesis protein [Bacteroidia bacterium]|nr:lipopolysaccharide biosynthesis protein [Bacteroidia bacterium]
MSLRSNVLKSVTWTLGTNFTGLVINLVLGVWLARILGPDSYGLVGMVLVITGFAKLLQDFGFGEAIIQKQDLRQEDYSSVFWFNMLVSLVLSLATFLCAPLIASFYDRPELIPITQALSIIFLLNAVAIVQRIRLEKEYKFKQLGIADVISSLISVVMALVAALNGLGVWSLVILHLVKAVAYDVVVWLYSGWLPSFTMKKKSLLGLSRFGLALFLNGLFENLASGIDKLLIGKSLGEGPLGVYGKSVSTVRMPVMQLMSALGRVIYPAFSQIQKNKDKIYAVYVQMVEVVTILIFPIMLGFVVFGDEIVLGLFGEKWIDMIPVFKILSLTTGLIPFNILVDQVVKSQGNVKYLNYITFIEKPLTIIAVIIGIWFGSIVTVAYSLAIGMIFTFLVKSYIAMLTLEHSMWKLLVEHIKATRILWLPVAAAICLYLFGLMDDVIIKLVVLASTGALSIGIFWKRLLVPIYHQVMSFRK